MITKVQISRYLYRTTIVEVDLPAAATREQVVAEAERIEQEECEFWSEWDEVMDNSHYEIIP